ncbi:hypothetical protein F5883DRAFT_177083 [Diaporthe sp. PMI_573]|nr:hypothetical protein F5883DRAFT_177083 [Diaporthaceae sp. PMI_573]
MASEEPGFIIPTDDSEATDTEISIGGSNIKTQSGIHSIESQGAQFGSTSWKAIDDANREDTIEHDSAHASSDKYNKAGSSTREELTHEDAKGSGPSPEDKDLTAWLKVQPKKVNVKWCDYESFKNRFSTEEGLDIIEVLEGHPDHLRAEILHERSKRRHKKNTEFRAKRQVGSDENLIHRVRIQSPAIIHILNRLSNQDDAELVSLLYLRPFRAFYYSLPFAKHILRMLERGYNDDQRHGTDGTRYSSSLGHLDAASSIATDDPLQKLSISPDVDMEDMIFGLPDLNIQAGGDSIAKEHIRLYIDFVEKHIVPMWVEARRSTKHKVRFSDLPMYFRPGDVLFEPLRAGDNKKRAGNAGSYAARNEGLAVNQNYWKLCHAQFQDPLTDGGRGGLDKDLGGRILNHTFRLFCFHVDFDGDRYGPVGCEIEISYFKGEIDIRSLIAYPLRFSADAKQTSNELTGRAKNFLSYVRERHLSYDGWTLIHETYGEDLSRSEKRSGAEHIEGEVMIDFKEGFQSDSGFFKPRLHLPHDPPVDNTNFDPLLAIDGYSDLMPTWWSDTTRSKKTGHHAETFQLRDSFCAIQSSHMKRQDKVLRAFEEEEMALNFDPDHLLLFPQRLIAYSFRARKFFVANIDCISVITTPESPFRDLKIASENKRILKSLVGSHFQKRDVGRQNKDAILEQDFVRGKGTGLVILLHGVPGVGKTTTAEAVALDNRKPLFALTSGDLGSTSRDVEVALRDTFRLAAMWDCVLLLDEADLFLAKRDVGDLVRNSLVSVFLRVLDYYDGVLFLTTNRVGTIDEAFRSRVHFSLYYPPLRRKQAREIFKLNIRRVMEIEKSKADLRGEGEDNKSILPPIEIDEASILTFANRQWDDTGRDPNRRWNGRQIRNSFQVAYSLVNLVQVNEPNSHYDDEYDDEGVDYGDEADVDTISSNDQNIGATATSPGKSVRNHKPGKLDSSQFEIVERSIRRFDRYLDRTRGPDSDNARSKNLRRDDFSDSENEDRSARDHGRYYYGARFPPSPHRGSHLRSPASPGYLAPPSDRGGRMQRDAARDREQRSYDRRRDMAQGQGGDDLFGETSRSRAGEPSGYSPRSRPREYDDEYESTHHRYGK